MLGITIGLRNFGGHRSAQEPARAAPATATAKAKAKATADATEEFNSTQHTPHNAADHTNHQDGMRTPKMAMPSWAIQNQLDTASANLIHLVPSRHIQRQLDTRSANPALKYAP